VKEFLHSLQDNKLLKTVSEPVMGDLEISSILCEFQNTAFLFDRVTGSSMSVAGNLFCRRENIETGLRISPGTLVDVVESAIRNPSSSKGRVSNFSKSDWSYNGQADLTKLPILTNFEGEAGRYITAGIVVAKFPGLKWENLSVHRMLVVSQNKVAARIVPRHLSQIGREAQGKVPISVVIGPPPSVFLSSSLQTQYGLSEYAIANKLSEGDLELTYSENSDVAVPLDSEIVLEGHIDFNELMDEGPFVDLTGTYDAVRKQPVITFERVHWKENPVYHSVVASTREHSIFMGLPQELKIREALSKALPKFRGINLTPSGGGYFHCVVSVEKSSDGDGKMAILNCFAASHPLKLVIAVDSDVDPFNLAEVEWALATRFQADGGTVIINGARGSTLDPSCQKVGITSKLGLDATLPINQDKHKYTKAMPASSSHIDLLKETIFKK